MNILFAPKTVVLQIPMATNYHFYHFQFTPFPTYHQNETIILSNNKTDIIVSTNERYFSEANSHDFAQCQMISSTKLCPSNILPLFNSIEEDSCLLHLLLSPVILSPECKYIAIEPKFIETKVVKNYLFVLKPTDDMCRIECGTQSKMTRARTFTVAATCSIWGKSFRVVGRSEHSIKWKKIDHNIMNRYVASNFVSTNATKITRLEEEDDYFGIISQDTMRIVVPMTGIVTLIVIFCIIIVCGYLVTIRKKMGKIVKGPRKSKVQINHKSIQ